MRELARVRAQAAKLRRRPAADEAVELLEDVLLLVDALRIECAGLQQRCSELEADRRRSDEGMQKLLDALPGPIVTTDACGTILDANRAACLLLARSRAKLTNDLLLHFAEDREQFTSVIRELPLVESHQLPHARFRPKDRAPVDTAVTVVRDPRIESPQWLWVFAPHTNCCISASSGTIERRARSSVG